MNPPKNMMVGSTTKAKRYPNPGQAVFSGKKYSGFARLPNINCAPYCAMLKNLATPLLKDWKISCPQKPLATGAVNILIINNAFKYGFIRSAFNKYLFSSMANKIKIIQRENEMTCRIWKTRKLIAPEQTIIAAIHANFSQDDLIRSRNT